MHAALAVRKAHNPLCTLFVLLGLVGIGYAQKAILPPSFVKGTRSVWSVREDLRFNVRVVPHPDLRSLKLEVWEMAPVAWAESFPFAPEGDRTMDEPEVRYERSGRHPIRSSDEQLDYPPFLAGETIDQWRTRVSPRTL